jgi:hypothetical protein
MMLNSGPPQAPLEFKCPACKTSLSKDDYRKALQESRKALFHNYKQELRELKRQDKNRISELKVLQQKQVRLVIAKERTRKRTLQEKLNKKTQIERNRLRQELREVKRKYQTKLEELRTVHADHNARLEAQLRQEYSNNLSELMKKYEEFAANSTQQLEVIHSSIHQLGEHLKRDRVVQAPPVEVVQQQEIGVEGKQEVEERRLEIERLNKIREISEMIKKIALQRQET